MPRKIYTPEYRADAVKLVVQEHQKVGKVSKDLGVSAPTLHGWVRESRLGTGVFTPKEDRQEQERVRAIEAENRRLKIECEILKKATAYFAKGLV